MKLLMESGNETSSTSPSSSARNDMYYEFEQRIISLDMKAAAATGQAFLSDSIQTQEPITAINNDGDTQVFVPLNPIEIQHQHQEGLLEDIVVDEDDNVFVPNNNNKFINKNTTCSPEEDQEESLMQRRRILLLRNHRMPRLVRRRCLFRSISHSPSNDNSSTDEDEEESLHHDLGSRTRESNHETTTAVVVAAKEKLVNLTQEKLKSYSTDFHSNSDGLRNRVLVESALKKFLQNDLSPESPTSPSSSSIPCCSSPCNTPVKKVSGHLSYRVSSSPGFTPPSTPRKRSSSESCLSPSTPSSTQSSSFSFDYDEEGASVLSDSIKRMKLIHSSPVSTPTRCSRLFDQETPIDSSMEDAFIIQS